MVTESTRRAGEARVHRAVTVAGTVLFALGVVDILRGIAHTALLRWAAGTIAGIDPHPDALMLLGVFGNSNFLTGALFVFVAWKARELAGYILGMIPLAYLVGSLGIRANGVTMQSSFSGRYVMLVYFAVCIVTFVYFVIAQRRSVHDRGQAG